MHHLRTRTVQDLRPRLHIFGRPREVPHAPALCCSQISKRPSSRRQQEVVIGQVTVRATLQPKECPFGVLLWIAHREKYYLLPSPLNLSCKQVNFEAEEEGFEPSIPR